MGVNSIRWNNGNTGPLNSDVSNGVAVFTINYDDDCIWSDSVTLEWLDPISFVLETFDADCEEASNGVLNITDVQGGSGSYSYSLEPESFQEASQFFNLSTGDYLAYVLDDNGCLAFSPFSIGVMQNILQDLPPIEPIELGEFILLNPLINQASIDSFQWSPSEYILNPDALVAEVQPEQTTVFTLTIYYGDCIEMRSVTVEVIQGDLLYISNIFKPGSVDNNTFFIQGKDIDGIQIHSLNIYDRWGNLVFEFLNPQINNPDHGWDGYYNNQKVNPGVFVYHIEYTAAEGKQYEAGSITVVR